MQHAGHHPACDRLVVRAKVDVNPPTAQLKVATDPGHHAAPQTRGGDATGCVSAVFPCVPTYFTAQNGATLIQKTKISVSGCPKLKVKKAAKGKGKTGKGKKARRKRS